MQEQILLAGSTEKSRMLLQTLLPPGTNPPPRMCMSGAETRRALGKDDWPLLVINTPLSDESGIDLAIDAASHTATSVLMLVKRNWLTKCRHSWRITGSSLSPSLLRARCSIRRFAMRRCCGIG